ncbi:D-2-hydroxyacid dehydrogenase [Pelagibius sp. Alg239-R121]|uniref:D-2-hydroxyacid dehydrogenase n=1 Tax=Pelagibius sp. Alg239-R121 TaxID=2993448 RepID=UPI0024A6A519|nr:D-2-hydroxyacid dehydrogenase [Pelagibius sp. Alg239-R121]
MEIFVSLDLNDRQAIRLREIAGEDKLHLHGCFDEGAPIEPSFRQCEVVLGNPPADWIAQAPALRWVQLESVGFGEYTDLNWHELGDRVTMTNLAGFFTEPVAESILAGILALYRGIDRLVCLQRDKDWQGDALRTELRTLKGAAVVLFGYGTISRRLAELLRPFDCELIPIGREWEREAIDTALATADVIVSTVPDTAATRGAFSRERLAGLKDTALFINFGRGSVVDEEALADALTAGSLGGAVVDVTLSEPLPDGHRFWTCPNMILTQHSGGGTADEIDRKLEVFSQKLERYRRGDQPAGTVDFLRGY